jgi:hypothetical protein
VLRCAVITADDVSAQEDPRMAKAAKAAKAAKGGKKPAAKKVAAADAKGVKGGMIRRKVYE